MERTRARSAIIGRERFENAFALGLEGGGSADNDCERRIQIEMEDVAQSPHALRSRQAVALHARMNLDEAGAARVRRSIEAEVVARPQLAHGVFGTGIRRV